MLVWGILAALAAADQGCGEDLFITQAEALAKILPCTALNKVLIDLKEPLALELPHLTHVDELRVTGPGVLSVALPALSTAVKLSVYSTPNMTSLAVPRLIKVDELGFVATGNLSTVAFPGGLTRLKDFVLADTRIQDISGILAREVDSLRVEDNLVLNTLAFDELVHVANNFVYKFNSLGHLITLPFLESIGGDLYLEKNSNVFLPSLETVGGNLLLYELAAEDFGLQVHAVDKSVVVRRCLHLKSLFLENLVSVGGHLSVLENPKLILIKLNRLHKLGGNLTIYANNVSHLELYSAITVSHAEVSLAISRKQLRKDYPGLGDFSYY